MGVSGMFGPKHVPRISLFRPFAHHCQLMLTVNTILTQKGNRPLIPKIPSTKAKVRPVPTRTSICLLSQLPPRANCKPRSIGTSYPVCAFCICLHFWIGKRTIVLCDKALLVSDSSTCRVNISNAAILGLKEDLNITSGTKYNTALTIFFVPYIIFEIPSNILLKKLKPHVWRKCFGPFAPRAIKRNFGKGSLLILWI